MEYISQDTFTMGNTAVSLGKFDGVHRGHRLLMEEIKKSSKREGLTSVVFTFSVHPSTLLTPEHARMIYTEDEKRILLEELGLDVMISYPFTKETLKMTAKNFVSQVLIGKLHAKRIVVGSDFRFGKGRQGDVDMLRQYSRVYGYELVVVDKLKENGQVISSTGIRQLLKSGEMERANALLGSPYFLKGTVVHGNHIGRATFSMPTANIIPGPEKLLPPSGVYATVTTLHGKQEPGITNVGVKPTVGDGYGIGVETNLFGTFEDFYGEEICVSFLKYIRPEQKFDSLQSLTRQMARDKETAESYFATL